MKKTIILLVIAVMFCAGCGNSDSSEGDSAVKVTVEPATEEITVLTADSLSLTAWFTPGSPAGEHQPLVVTLPMMRHTHETYDLFVAAVKDYFKTQLPEGSGSPNFLNLDLRGHGKSTKKGSETLKPETMSNEEFARIPSDVKLMIEKVVEENPDTIDTSFIAVVGASIGANSAMLLTELMPGIKKVVLLSAGENYHGLQPAEAFKAFRGQVLVVTGRSDRYALESAQTIVSLKMENWLMKMYSGSHHGTNIINADQRALTTVVEWLFGEEE